MEENNNIQNVIILRGLPGCGKTTWAREFMQSRDKGKWKRVNRDDLRLMFDNDFWSEDSERFIKKIEVHLIVAALMYGYNVIVDSTNLNLEHTNIILRAIRHGHEDGDYGNVGVVTKDFFDVSVDECIRRDSMRSKPVGEAVIRNLDKRLQALLKETREEEKNEFRH